MSTLSGQGNNNPQYQYAANSLLNVTIYCPQTTPIVGSTFYADASFTTLMPAGWYRLDLANNDHRVYTVNSSGVVTAVAQCSWSSTKSYTPANYSGTRNNCASGSTAGSVTINNGGSYTYSGTATYTSYISQTDADTQALAAATTNFNNGVQNYINSVATCTWTSTQTRCCSGDYTKNNCASNCYGTVVNYNPCSTQTRTSTVSQSDADLVAANAASIAACEDRNNNGQNNANYYGGCCCWVGDPSCVPSSCDYMGDRQRNTCTGEYRYTNITGTSCSCGESCGGSYFEYSCGGQYNYDRYRQEKWSCTGNIKTANTLLEECSASCNANSSPVYESKGYTTCYACTNVNVYQDINHCSATKYSYFVYYNGYVNVGAQPSGIACNTDSQCVDSGSPYCSGGNYQINQVQNNSCSGTSCGVRVIQYNSTTYGCVGNCITYNIIAYNSYSTVTGTYTNCSGSTNQSFSFTSGSSTGFVGTVCARSGSVSVNSGNGRSESSGNSCGTYPLS